MAITKTKGTLTDISTVGSYTISHDAGSNPKFAIVTVFAVGYTPYVTNVKYGGVALTLLARGKWTTGSPAYTEVWGKVGGLPSGVNDFTMDQATNYPTRAMPYTGTADGPVQLGNTYTGNGASGAYCPTVNSTLPAMTFTGNGGTYSGVCGGANVEYDGHAVNVGGAVSEIATATGSRSVGISGNHIHGGAAVMVEELEVDFTPDPIGMEMGFNAGALAEAADKYLPGVPLRELLLGLNAGELSALAPRQVALVGEGVETATMTEGGVDGYKLTYHPNRPPDWEEASGAALTVEEEDGSPSVTDVATLGFGSQFAVTSPGATEALVNNAGHWEPVIYDGEVVTLDGDIVMYWVAE